MNVQKLRSITKIAVPAIAESLAAVIVTSIDTKMVSSLGPQAIFGISFTTQPKLMLFTIFVALGTALNVFVAQAYGRKKDFTTLSYSKILAYSVETAGTFDLDSELDLWFSGMGRVRFEFVARADVTGICRMISKKVL